MRVIGLIEGLPKRIGIHMGNQTKMVGESSRLLRNNSSVSCST